MQLDDLTTGLIVQIAIMVPIGGMAIVLLGIAIKRGALRESVLQSGPSRAGNLMLFDFFGTMMLFLVLPSLMVMMLQSMQPGVASRASASNPGGVDPEAKLMLMVASQFGFLLLVTFLMMRAAVGLEEGLKGFGLGWERFLTGKKIMWVSMLIGIPMSMVVVGFLVRWIGTMVGHPPPDIGHGALLAMLNASPSVKIGLIVSTVLIAPVLEEIIFRGMLQTSLVNGAFERYRWVAILIVASLFSLVHFSGVATVHVVIALLPLSIGLGYLYERTGSLIACIVMHAVFNGLNILGLFLLAGGGEQMSHGGGVG